MFRKSVSFLLLSFCITILVCGQTSIATITDTALKAMVQNGYNDAAKLVRSTLGKYPQKNIAFNFDESIAEATDSKGYSDPYGFTALNTSEIYVPNIYKIKYSFYFIAGKLKHEFWVIHTIGKTSSFPGFSTVYELMILDSLSKGACKACFLNAEKFAQKHKIKNYTLAVDLRTDGDKLAQRFFWQMKTVPSNGMSTLYFVNPMNGKEVVLNQSYIPPIIGSE